MKFTYTILLILLTSYVLEGKEISILRLSSKNARPQTTMNYSLQLGGKTGMLWRVYSDKDNNVTYKDAKGQEPKSKLQFVEACYVIAEKGEYVQVVSIKGIGEHDRGKLNVTNPDKQITGWIHKKNVVLWPRCLLTERGITRKGVILNNIDVLQKVPTKTKIALWGNPEMSQGDTTAYTQLFDIFYIYKIDKKHNAALLSTQSEIGNNADTGIKGWIDASKITFWNSNITLEPNNTFNAIEERKDKNIALHFLNGEKIAQRYQQGHNIQHDHIYLTMENTETLKRRNGYIWRYPVLEEMRDKQNNLKYILEVIAMGSVFTGDNEKVDEELRASTLRRYNNKRQALKNINIVFVLDGTEGMQNYLNAIAMSIQQNYNKILTDKNAKIGVVVYRNENADNHKIETYPLTKKIPNIVKYINHINTNFTVDEKGNVVLTALKSAIRDTKLNKNHTNIIITVGKEGTKDINENEIKEVTQLIEANNCHIIGIQVKKDDTSELYDNFTDIVEELMLESAMAQKQKILNVRSKNKVLNKSQNKVHLYEPQFFLTPNLDYFKYELRNTSAIGISITPESNRVLPESVVQTEVTNTLTSISDRVDAVLNILDIFFRGTGNATSDHTKDTFNPAILHFLNETLTLEQQNTLSENAFQGSKRTFTALQIENQTNRLFKYVLFLDAKELAGLVNAFDDIHHPNLSMTEQREAVFNGWNKLFTTYSKDDDKTYLTHNLGSLQELIFGIPSSSQFLQQFKLSDIHTMKDDDFQEYVDKIRKSKVKLTAILNAQEYPYSFAVNNQRFYWISEDDLP